MPYPLLPRSDPIRILEIFRNSDIFEHRGLHFSAKWSHAKELISDHSELNRSGGMQPNIGLVWFRAQIGYDTIRTNCVVDVVQHEAESSQRTYNSHAAQ